MTPRFIMNTYKDHKPGNLTTMKQLYKARDVYYNIMRGPFIEMKHLVILIHGEIYLCWTRNRKDSNVVTNSDYNNQT